MDVNVLMPLLSERIDPKLKQFRVSIYKEMIVHTRGLKPYTLLKTVRPYEPDEIIKYREQTWQSITRDPILRALNSTYHLIKQSDYKLIVGDKTREYLAVKKFESFISTNKLSLTDLIFKSYNQLSIEDPNGVILWKAINPINRNDVPNNLSKLQKIDIESEYINCDRIEICTERLLMYENGEVEVKKNVKAKKYIVIDDTDMWVYMPISINDKNIVIYELQPYYKHGFGFAPFMVLGGIETLRTDCEDDYKERKNEFLLVKKENKEYRFYDSFFTAYNAWGNKAITAWTEVDAVKVMSSFPIRVVADTVCTNCKGVGHYFPEDCRLGRCSHSDKTICSDVSCKTCGGSGHLPALSPYSTIKRKPKNDLEQADTRPEVEWLMPPLEAVQVNKDFAYEMLDKAEQSLSVYESRNVQSGVAKELDLEQKRDQISVIADNLFNLLEFSARCISRYLQDETPVILIKPTRYEIRNKESIIKEINDIGAISKDLAKALMLEYVDKELEGDDKRAMELLIENDDYYGWSSEELAKEKAMGADSNGVSLFDDKMFQFHRKGLRLISKAIKDNPTLSDEAILNLVYG